MDLVWYTPQEKHFISHGPGFPHQHHRILNWIFWIHVCLQTKIFWILVYWQKRKITSPLSFLKIPLSCFESSSSISSTPSSSLSSSSDKQTGMLRCYFNHVIMARARKVIKSQGSLGSAAQRSLSKAKRLTKSSHWDCKYIPKKPYTMQKTHLYKKKVFSCHKF